MFVNVVIIILTVAFTITGIGVAVWSFVDTRRHTANQTFISDRTIKRQEAEKRFKEKTRLGK